VRHAVLLLVLASATTFALGLDRPAITESDEAYYAEASREMLESGDWLTPRFNYAERFQKPVLYYWVTATIYRVAGVGEAQARAGAALAGLGLVLVTFACGRRWYDARTGLLGGLVLATSLGCVAVARLSLPDLPLAFFISLAIWAAFVTLFDRPRVPRRWYLLAGAAAGLAFLTKGPLGLVIPAIVVAPPFFLERGWRRLRWTDLALAVLLGLAVSVPWYAAMTFEHGPRYLQGFFVGDNLERFATTAYNSPRPVFYYVPVVLAGLLPWSPFLALGVSPAWQAWKLRRRPGRVEIRLLGWTLLPLLLFTASVGKQPRYVLPMLPPLALGLAALIRSAVTTLPPLPGAQPRLFRILACVSGMLVALLGVLLLRIRPLLLDVPAGRVTAGSLVLLLAGLAVVLAALSRRWRQVPAAIAASGVAIVLVLQFAVLTTRATEPVRAMAQHVLEQRRAAEPVAPYGVFTRNLVFYTHVEQVDLFNRREHLLDYLSRPDRVLGVMRESEFEALRASACPRLRRLATLTYFDAATSKPRTLLWPDPERDLVTAVLVDNGK
jgi:4-amino-4-deoxy-L-arabinose transferase-like glycosyltransferase